MNRVNNPAQELKRSSFVEPAGIARLRRWLLPPMDDETDQLRARLLGLALLFLFVASLVALPFTLHFYDNRVNLFVLIGVSVNIGTIYALRRARLRLAGNMLMFNLTGLAFALMLNSNGIYDVAMYLLPVLLMGASATISRFDYWLLTGLMVTGIWMTAWLHRHDWFDDSVARFHYQQIPSDTVFYTLFLVLIALVAQTFVGALLQLLRRAQFSERALQVVNSELDMRVAQRTAELETATHELETFAYSISHDLRTPLRAISGYASILVSESDSRLGEADRSMLLRIDSAAKRLSALIDSLLRFSRLNTQHLDIQRIQLRELVPSIIEHETRELTERRIDWRLGDLPDIHGDLQLIRVVLHNLIGNAIKFTARQDPAVIDIGCHWQNGRIRVTISDNGAGFDPAYADKLFRVFQRLHTQHEFPGEGVGLAAVKRIIERHGGEVSAHSSIGEGARFEFSLPGNAG